MSASDPIAALAERLGHSFADGSLLERAMCHRSWCAENPGNESNERLEFLGDAVLGLIVADHVFRGYPGHDEGWLSRARSSVVRASALGEMAANLEVGPALRLGKGEASSGGREKTSILADAMEAVIGAVYLDGGWTAVCTLVLGLIEERVAALPGGRGDQDHKSMLQELTMRRLQTKPFYEVQESGPEHHKTFAVAVVLEGRRWGFGEGRSKKEAEQLAACDALAGLERELQAMSEATSAGPLDGDLLDGPQIDANPVAYPPPLATGEPHDA